MRRGAMRRRTAGRSRVRAGSRTTCSEIAPVHRGRRQHQRRQRQQHDGGEEKGREAESQPEAGQDAGLAKAHGAAVLHDEHRPLPAIEQRTEALGEARQVGDSDDQHLRGRFRQAPRQLAARRRRSAARCASPAHAPPAPPSAHRAVRACRAAGCRRRRRGRFRRTPLPPGRGAARSPTCRGSHCARLRPGQ